MSVVDVGYDPTNDDLLGRDDDRRLVEVGMPGTLPRLAVPGHLVLIEIEASAG